MLNTVIQLLLNNPLLLLFVVTVLGYPLGRISIGSSSLGVASVLFVGLAIGSLHPDLKLPELVYQLGLVVFVYTIGLSNGRQFFESFRRRGLRDNLFVAGMLVAAAAVTALISLALGLRPALAAGLFTGSLTNTPALAAVLEHIKEYVPAALRDQMLAEPVVGFSIAYPVGVVGMIAALALARRVWRVDYQQEAQSLNEITATGRQLHNRTIAVTKAAATGIALQDLALRNGWEVVFGRIRHGGQLALAGTNTRLAVGDLVSVIGPTPAIERVAESLGQLSDERLEFDRSQLDYRRIFVSNPKIAGQRLRDLQLPQRFGAIVTRVRRGDIELLAQDNTAIELGDRVRVVAPRQNMAAIGTLFGDSYRALSEIDVLTFNLGLALGVLLGLMPIPLPGGMSFKLGVAGGPLIVALILGTFERTGPLVWGLPYSANLTLRQIGLVLFLAGIGTRSGYTFVSTLTQGGGGVLFLAGALITITIAFATLWVGYRLLKIPMGLLSGMLAGLQTQPAVLGFALEQAGNELPNIGYAAVYPVALIAKIVLAQLLLSLLT